MLADRMLELIGVLYRVERDIRKGRRIAMWRRSWLFCWTELGAEHGCSASTPMRIAAPVTPSRTSAASPARSQRYT